MFPLVSELCVLAALAGATPQADNDPAQWLERMAYAVERLNYDGTFVHIIKNDTVEAMRIVHKVGEDGKVSERLISLDGSREIIRNDDEVRCVLEGNKSVVVERHKQNPLLERLPLPRAGLESLYSFEMAGRQVVANRNTRIIEVMPRDEYRYGHRLWLDEQTALPLHSALIDKGGAIVEQILFTTISVDESISDEKLRPSIATGENYRWFVAKDSRDDPAGEAAWQAESLPRGFRLTVARKQGDDSETQHYVYTDGLASVSVFIEKVGSGNEPLSGLSSIGSATAYATTVGDYQITAVGEVPPSTVEMIGASLKRRQ